MRNWRINLIFILIILFGAAIISRLFYIQFFQHDYYRALAQGQQKNFQIIKGERGRVFFSGGQVLAGNIIGSYVFVVPAQIEDKEKAAEAVSKIINIDEKQLLETINKGAVSIIKNKITPEEEKELKEKNLKGVFVNSALYRIYPYFDIASQVIGFVGGEDAGQYGIEGFYDEQLQGKEKWEDGKSDLYFSSKGADIYLSLDYNIQFTVEQLLKKAKNELDIEGGQIVVMEPASGKILAIANFPNFDPNNYSKEADFKIFQNKIIQELYEPGSAFKPITMAAALDKEKVTPQTTYIDTGLIKVGGLTISNYDHRVWGERTMTEVFEKSINTGAVFAEQQLGSKLFMSYVDKFGFFKPTGIDLQGEVFSENKELKKGYDINYMTAAFGQGIEITPMQLLRAFSAIANDGRLVTPYIVEKIDEQGSITEIKPQISSEQIISKKTVAQLTAMLVSVVENGFGKQAKIPGYYIAGKTGTSQIPWSSLGINKKGYSDNTWQSFIGFGPAFNARFLILIKLDNPKTSTAEYSAVPIFKELAKYIIDYLQIPPDRE